MPENSVPGRPFPFAERAEGFPENGFPESPFPGRNFPGWISRLRADYVNIFEVPENPPLKGKEKIPGREFFSFPRFSWAGGR